MKFSIFVFFFFSFATFSIKLFKVLADRYKTSLTATVLKWIDMTDKMAMAVFSDNGFIEWKKQSATLLKKKIFGHKREYPEERANDIPP